MVPAATAVTAMFAAMVIAFIAIIGLIDLFRRRLGRRGLRTLALAPLNNLVQLAAIQPYAAAFRAIIYFNSLAITHQEVDLTDWTEQSMSG